ncbi:MAG: YidC/Oxa1 family membrane protein insertase [Firmicutes bacterium]|nr:YidC/Oxa1 family membrane protein insertase [Bacillota bacterium]
MQLTLLLSSSNIAPPTGMWEWFLLNVFGFVAHYGWRIILFTVLLKLVLSPLDFYQRFKMRKNQAITERLKPQMEKLEKQYKDDKRGFQAAQMQLQRANGFSIISSCIPMIVTLVIFFTFFAGMRGVTQFTEFKEYLRMYTVYSDHHIELTGFNPIFGLEGETFSPVGENQGEVGSLERLIADKTIWEYRQENAQFNTALAQVLSEGTARQAFERHGGEGGQGYHNFIGQLLMLRARESFFVGQSGQTRIFNVEAPIAHQSITYITSGLIHHGPVFYDIAKVHHLLNLPADQTSPVPDEILHLAKTNIINAVNQNLTARDNPSALAALSISPSFENSLQGFSQLYISFNDIVLAADYERDFRLFLAQASQMSADHVKEEYPNIRTSFLWIKNIWVADTPWGRPVSDFNTFRGRVGSYLDSEPPLDENGNRIDAALHARLRSASVYNAVTSSVQSDTSLSRTNGFLILAVLALGFSVLSQYVMQKQQKKSGQINQMTTARGGGAGGMMKIMTYMMPLMIGVFALISSSAFTIYMITNSVMTLIINLVVSLIVTYIFNKKGDSMFDKKAKDGQKKEGWISKRISRYSGLGGGSGGIERYGRIDPNDLIQKVEGEEGSQSRQSGGKTGGKKDKLKEREKAEIALKEQENKGDKAKEADPSDEEEGKTKN